jgi:regulatory protein
MVENDLFKTILSKAMALCANHEYCSAEIRSRLNSWSVDSNDTEKIMSYLIKERFIDDSRYTSAFVKDKFRQNKWGKVKISAHLRSKSLGDDLIRSALDEIDDEAYIDMIREVINDHRRLVKAKNQYDMKGKLLRFALSRGYESHLVYDILNESDQ